MATKKAGGSSKNLRDSNPKYLGTKLHDGEAARAGMIIVRQRGTKILPGTNVRVGRDHTLYAAVDGKIAFGTKRKISFNDKTETRKVVHVVSAA